MRDPWGSEVRVTHTRMRYEVTLEWREPHPGIPRIQVAHEAAYPITKDDDEWATRLSPSKPFRAAYLKYARTKPWLTTEEKPEGLTFNIHQDGRQGRRLVRRPANSADVTALYSITDTEFPHLFALREEMRHWRLLQLDPALLRKPVPATASDVLNADGSNLAAVLAQLKAETASETRPSGVLFDIGAELNNLIPGISRLDAALHDASREYRIELTMRDGVPFSSRVISDGTLRVLALLTLLHDPRHRGLICFEEPENGVHPGRVKELVQRLREMVTSPREFAEDDPVAPLSQLLLNSHSPVVLSALVDRDLCPVDGSILFADTTTVIDTAQSQRRRRTRLRPIRPKPQRMLEGLDDAPSDCVSDYEVCNILETARTDG